MTGIASERSHVFKALNGDEKGVLKQKVSE
jgi:hypothetical protein